MWYVIEVNLHSNEKRVVARLTGYAAAQLLANVCNRVEAQPDVYGYRAEYCAV